MELLSGKEIKKRCALNTAFSEGRQLYDCSGVFGLALQKTAENQAVFSAYVEGRGSRDYETTICFKKHSSTGNMQYEDASCECPDYENNGGFCKHLCAMMLEINDNISEHELRDLITYWKVGDSCSLFEGMEDFAVSEEEFYTQSEDICDNGSDAETTPSNTVFVWKETQKTEERKKNSGQAALSKKLEDFLEQFEYGTSVVKGGSYYGGAAKMDEQKLYSSKELLDAISGVVLQERNQFCQELAGGDVELEPVLRLEKEAEKLELRIGKQQMYVIKDVEQFVERIRKQSYYEYGKKLAFVHNQSAFTKESLELVSLLLETEFAKDSYYYYGRASDRRYLELDARFLDKMMQLYEGKSLFVDCILNTKKEMVSVIRQNPRLPININEKDGGALIRLPEIILLEGLTGFYIWWENCIYICNEKYGRDMKELLKLMTANFTRAERQKTQQSFLFSAVRNRNLTLSEKDYTSFCSTLLPLFEKYTDLRVNGIDFSDYQVEDGKYEVYLDIAKNQEIICDAKAIYGEKEHNLIKVAGVLENYRDIRTEYELRTLLEQYFPEHSPDGTHFVLKQDDDRLAGLVEYGVDQLKNLADVYASEEFKKIKLATNVAVAAGLSIKGNLLHVTWDVEGMSKDELYDILNAYRRKKKYHRLRSGELLNLGNSGLDVFADMQEDLQLTKAQIKSGMAEVPVYRALYLNALMKENVKRITVSRDEMFERLIDRFEDMHERKYEFPKDVCADLRNYQKEGFQWACALSELGFGGILADDMGLGKTLQMITYLCTRKGMTHLVVCPASLVYNWEAEFAKFAPHIRVCLMLGGASERQMLLEHYMEYDVLVTSYDLLKRDIEYYEGKHFGCEIIDEAQYIKNVSTQAAKAVKAIDSRTRFALTGTPIENRLSELWSIFEYLMPGYLYSYKYFKENFEEQIVQKTEGEQKALDKIHTMIRPFIMRRLKQDVLDDLPDKIEEVVYSRFEPKQEKLYRATEKNIVMNLKKKSKQEVNESKIQILAELTKLRQICCDPQLYYGDYQEGSAKLNTCIELIESAVEGGHRILLFSQFASMLEILAKQLENRKIRYFLLRGSTTKRKRKDMVEQFQAGEAEVFLISLKAGGTGLNLTAADVVIHYDPWWNMAAQNQATDRTHRIGQKNNVTVYKLIMKDSIEERILKLQDMKKDLADKIISEEGISFAALSKEDILKLFEY